MRRRPGRAMAALAVTMVAFVAFGVARVAAPGSALGLVFDEPLAFGVFTAIFSVVGALLLFAKPVELAVARVLAGPARVPSDAEAERIGGLLGRVGKHSGARTDRLIVRVLDDPGVNASAGATHLLYVTTGALERPDDELEAILAHELGHHRGLHPVLTMVVWWLRLPGVLLAGVYNALRAGVAALGSKLGAVGKVLAIPLLVLLIVWQVTVMWLFFVGELLAARAARLSEYEADGNAARWGYGPRLAAALRRLAGQELEPTGRWVRLTAEHPPIADRINRLEPEAAPIGRPEGSAPRTPA